MINQLFTFLIRLPQQSTDLIVIHNAACFVNRSFRVVSRYRLASGPVAVVVNARILICSLHIQLLRLVGSHLRVFAEQVVACQEACLIVCVSGDTLAHVISDALFQETVLAVYQFERRNHVVLALSIRRDSALLIALNVLIPLIGLYTVDGDKLALPVEVIAYNVVLGSDYTKRGCRKSLCLIFDTLFCC